MIDRPRSIRIPCTEEEFQQAHALAEAEGLTVAAFLRSLVRQYAERTAAKKTAKGRSRR